MRRDVRWIRISLLMNNVNGYSYNEAAGLARRISWPGARGSPCSPHLPGATRGDISDMDGDAPSCPSSSSQRIIESRASSSQCWSRIRKQNPTADLPRARFRAGRDDGRRAKALRVRDNNGSMRSLLMPSQITTRSALSLLSRGPNSFASSVMSFLFC